MKKIKILFQGDSITDAGRDRSDCHNLGNSYPLYASELIKKAYPDVEFEFFNFGISGNRTCQLFDRLSNECIDLQPDVVSVFIGINDVWHRYDPTRIMTTDAQIELNYTCILNRIKNETNAKIMMIQPYVEGNSPAEVHSDLEQIKPMLASLAEDHADAYIKLDELMRADENYGKPNHFTRDGIHPNENGAKFIAKLYFEAIKPLIDDLLSLERK